MFLISGFRIVSFKSKYAIRTTPKVYILDRDKEIIMKDIPAEKLEEIMNEILERENLKKTEQQD